MSWKFGFMVNYSFSNEGFIIIAFNLGSQVLIKTFYVSDNQMLSSSVKIMQSFILMGNT